MILETYTRARWRCTSTFDNPQSKDSFWNLRASTYTLWASMTRPSAIPRYNCHGYITDSFSQQSGVRVKDLTPLRPPSRIIMTTLDLVCLPSEMKRRTRYTSTLSSLLTMHTRYSHVLINLTSKECFTWLSYAPQIGRLFRTRTLKLFFRYKTPRRRSGSFNRRIRLAPICFVSILVIGMNQWVWVNIKTLEQIFTVANHTKVDCKRVKFSCKPWSTLDCNTMRNTLV